MTRLTRRSVVAALGTSTIGITAGCLGDFTGASDNPSEPADQTDEWPQFRRDSVFSGTRPAEEGPGDDLEESWAWTGEDVKTQIAEASDRVDDPERITLLSPSSPVGLDDTVVVEIEFDLDFNRALIALDGETGTPVWAYAFDDVVGGRLGPTPLSPALADGRVYHVVLDGEDDARLVALDLETGELEWSERVSYGTPVIRDETLYLVGADAISAFELGGDLVWNTTDVSLTNHRATVTADAILAMDKAEIVAHDCDDGEEQWRAALVDPEWLEGELPPFTPPVIAEGLAVAARSEQRQGLRTSVGLVAFDPESGDVEWGHGSPFVDSEEDPEGNGALVGYPLIADDVVLATATGRGLIEAANADPDQTQLFALDLETGELEWTAPAPQTFAPVLAGEIVYLVGWSQVVAISTEGERLAGTDTTAGRYRFFSAPAVANGSLYVPTSMAGDDGVGLVAFGG